MHWIKLKQKTTSKTNTQHEKLIKINTICTKNKKIGKTTDYRQLKKGKLECLPLPYCFDHPTLFTLRFYEYRLPKLAIFPQYLDIRAQFGLYYI